MRPCPIPSATELPFALQLAIGVVVIERRAVRIGQRDDDVFVTLLQCQDLRLQWFRLCQPRM